MADVKVKLLKDHNGSKKGAVGEIAKGRADYLVRMGVAEYVKVADPNPKASKSTKAVKTVKPKEEKKVEAETPCKTC